MKRVLVSKKECAEKVNEAIMQWARGKEKLIVAIDGYTGSGKTTLLDQLARMNPSVLAVHRDDFVLPRAKAHRLFLRAKDREKFFEKDICNIPKIKRLLSAFRRNARSCTIDTYNHVTGTVDVKKTFDTTKSILVIEGVFLFHPRTLNKLWDRRIYLDGDTAAIDRQRVRREKKKWGAEYIPETDPESFLRYITLALKHYRKRYKPEAAADLVVYMK